MWWTDSNLDDAGANEKRTLVMRFIQGEKLHQNSKVNLEEPVAKQRGSELVIIDVTNLDLEDNQKMELSAAIAKFYESNFWIKFKSIGIMTWLALILTVSI